jgi:hypothetical protein
MKNIYSALSAAKGLYPVGLGVGYATLLYMFLSYGGFQH